MERRHEAHRARVLKTGLIAPDGHFTSMDCLVRDISAHGARLQVESMFGVPDRFDLKIVNEHFMRPAEVRWRHGRQLGVEFREPVKTRTGPFAEVRARRTEDEFPPVPKSVTG